MSLGGGGGDGTQHGGTCPPHTPRTARCWGGGAVCRSPPSMGAGRMEGGTSSPVGGWVWVGGGCDEGETVGRGVTPPPPQCPGHKKLRLCYSVSLWYQEKELKIKSNASSDRYCCWEVGACSTPGPSPVGVSVPGGTQPLPPPAPARDWDGNGTRKVLDGGCELSRGANKPLGTDPLKITRSYSLTREENPPPNIPDVKRFISFLFFLNIYIYIYITYIIYI